MALFLSALRQNRGVDLLDLLFSQGLRATLSEWVFCELVYVQRGEQHGLAASVWPVSECQGLLFHISSTGSKGLGVPVESAGLLHWPQTPSYSLEPLRGSHRSQVCLLSMAVS